MKLNQIRSWLPVRAAMIVALIGVTISVNAEDKFYLPDFSIKAGETKQLAIQFESDNVSASNPNWLEYVAFQFDIYLPEGLTIVQEKEKYHFTFNTDRSDDHTFTSAVQEDGAIRVAGASLTNAYFWGTSGDFVYFSITAAEDFTGSHEIAMKRIMFSTKEAVRSDLADVTTTVTGEETGDSWITLDETSTELPEASDGDVQIKVKRTIKAGEWSTICLPFSMTEAQVYEAFGEDVQLMKFVEYVAEYDDANDDVTSISVVFENVDLQASGFEANYPYIIKTTTDISEFTATSTIAPNEGDAYIEFDNGRIGSKKEVYGTFYGTLKSGTTIPENCLFLNSKKFYYSAGKTSIMAFRGYFEFVEVLSSVGNAASAITLRIGEENTGLNALQNGATADGKVYDLQGRMIENPGKGIYIKNNKKIIIK